MDQTIIELREIVIKRVRIAASIMAVPIVLGFSLVDWFVVPFDTWVNFLVVRSLIIPLSFLIYFSYSLKVIREKYFEIPALALALYIGVQVAYMIQFTGGETSTYYAGLNLAAIGGMFFLPLNRKQLTLMFFCVFGPYSTLMFFRDNLNMAYFIPHTAFTLSTVVLGFAVNHISRALLIKKTREGVNLEKLASQFSPQVISGIKNEEFSLTDRLRKEVTCIFIDIENSTDRVAKLDHTDYISMLSEFFSEVVEILLDHNVTIGTYLGDGLLAFTNAPQANPRHAEQAVEACLKILSMHGKRRRFYNERWRSSFNIRIGINSGYAHLGFFPNERHGTYTAIGGTVNLASRLCSIASPNSICITKYQLRRVAEGLPQAFIEMKSEFAEIKGFDNERFELYTIKPLSQADSKEHDNCPLCSSDLKQHKDFGSIILLKCTDCGYSHPQVAA